MKTVHQQIEACALFKTRHTGWALELWLVLPHTHTPTQKLGRVQSNKTAMMHVRKEEITRYLQIFRAHQTKSTPAESEEDRTQKDAFRAFDSSSVHPFRFIAFNTAENSHGWQSDMDPTRLFARRLPAIYPWRTGGKIWCEPAEPLGQSKYTNESV